MHLAYPNMQHIAPPTHITPPTLVRRYIPVIEDLVIDVSSRKISLESEVGPFRFLIKVWKNAWIDVRVESKRSLTNFIRRAAAGDRC